MSNVFLCSVCGELVDATATREHADSHAARGDAGGTEVTFELQGERDPNAGMEWIDTGMGDVV